MRKGIEVPGEYRQGIRFRLCRRGWRTRENVPRWNEAKFEEGISKCWLR